MDPVHLSAGRRSRGSGAGRLGRAAARTTGGGAAGGGWDLDVLAADVGA